MGDPWPLYAALDRDTMWAEWRHATDARTPPSGETRWVCAFDADLSVLDLRDPEVRRALGVTLAELLAPWAPGAPNRSALRATAAAWRLGADAMIVPSAALSEGWNVVIRPEAFPRLRPVSRRRARPDA